MKNKDEMVPRHFGHSHDGIRSITLNICGVIPPHAKATQSSQRLHWTHKLVQSSFRSLFFL